MEMFVFFAVRSVQVICLLIIIYLLSMPYHSSYDPWE